MNLEVIKQHSDILAVAHELGFYGQRTGSIYQGDCPRHYSTGGRCLTIYPSSGSFHCFHCREGSDVIDLVKMYKKCSFKEAVLHLISRDEENLGKYKAEIEKGNIEKEEANKVYDMLTDAQMLYYEYLKNNTEIYSAFKQHYGFSDELINEQKIGYADPGQIQNFYNELHKKYGDEILKTGLVDSNSGYHYLKNRIVFPIWSYGKVVYMAGRTIDFVENEVPNTLAGL